MVSTDTSGNWGSLTLKIQAIILCTELKISVGAKYTESWVFQQISRHRCHWKETIPKNDVKNPSLQQCLCTRSNTAQPTTDTDAHLRVSGFLSITTSTGKSKWIFWATTISNTSTIWKETGQAAKLQLLLISKHLLWHPLQQDLWLSPFPAAAALFTQAQPPTLQRVWRYQGRSWP